MKIWIVNQYAVPPTAAGGTRHFSLAKQLHRMGHEPVVVTSGSYSVSGNTTKDLPPVSEHTYEGVPFLTLKSPEYKKNDFRRAWNMLSFALQVGKRPGILGKHKPDVIVGSSPSLFAAYAAMKLAKKLKVPFVLEIRDLWPQSIIEIGSYSEKHPLIRTLTTIESRLYRNAQEIVVLPPFAGEFVAARGGNLDHITPIPNGIDLDIVPAPQEPQPQEVFTVMFAGAHGPANGLDILLDAGKILQERGYTGRIKIQLIGGGPAKAKLVARVEAENIETVELRDAVPKNEIYAVMNTAGAFVITLRNEGVFRFGVSPNKLFDYMAMARPVIFSIKAPNSPVDDCNGGLTIEPDNKVAMADAIIQLFEMSPEDRWAMGQRARTYVEAHHSFTALGSKLAAVIERAVATSK